MSVKYLTDLDLALNELQNGVVQSVATLPAVANAKEGQIVVLSTDHTFRVFLDGKWVNFGDSSDIEAAIRAIQDTIGDMSTATTTAKTVVGAINELDAAIDSEVTRAEGVEGDITAYSSTNYIANNDSLAAAAGKLDAQAKVNADAIATINDSDVMKSGITATKVASYDAHIADTTNPHGTTVANLGDTTIAETLADGEVLAWDATAEKWVNTTPTTLGDISATAPITFDSETGVISAEYDATPTAESDKLMHSKDIKTAVDGAEQNAKNYADTQDTVLHTTITSEIEAAVADKIELTDLSIATGSANYLEYDNTNGQFGAKVDTTVTASSTNLITSGAVKSAIDSALVGGVIYQGTWSATDQTDYSSIILPVRKGDLFYVSAGENVKIGDIEWNKGDFLLVDADVAEGGTLTAVSKIDNSESSDIVRLDATQTLTNKAIDADDNTISNLEVDNFKSGVVATSIHADPTEASDTVLVTEKAISTALVHSYVEVNPELAVSGGKATWTVSHGLNTIPVSVTICEVATGAIVYADVSMTATNVTIKMNASEAIAAGTYRVLVLK